MKYQCEYHGITCMERVNAKLKVKDNEASRVRKLKVIL